MLFLRPDRYRRSLWAWVLIGALLAAQALGFWHRVLHTAAIGGATATVSAPGHPALFDGHREDGSDCRLFDALATAALGVWTIPALFGLHRLGAFLLPSLPRRGRLGWPTHHAQARAPPRTAHAR
jgi:hypothetical protein